MASFGELGAARLQLVRDPRGAPPLAAASAQQVTILDTDGRVTVVQTQDDRLEFPYANRQTETMRFVRGKGEEMEQNYDNSWSRKRG